MSKTVCLSFRRSRPPCRPCSGKRLDGEVSVMDFRLPELGEGVYEAELVAWQVSVGDTIKRGQNLMEVLTDKASMEVPSPFAGKITRLYAEPGQKIKVGENVLSYESTADKEAPAVSGNGEEQN